MAISTKSVHSYHTQLHASHRKNYRSKKGVTEFSPPDFSKSSKSHVMCSQKNRINETALLSRQNICFRRWGKGSNFAIGQFALNEFLSTHLLRKGTLIRKIPINIWKCHMKR